MASRSGGEGLWLLEQKEQFRELADPTALWDDGKWYLYPSVDMAWVSVDNGATWQHHPLNIRDVGYAPTVVKHRGKFLLMASDSALYSSDSALGPFTKSDASRFPASPGCPVFTDPMLFSDDDGRLFFYWGCTQSGGIWGVELNATNLTSVLTTPKELIHFDPVAFPWEAVGDWNQNTTSGWVEGSWMIKHGGKYFPDVLRRRHREPHLRDGRLHILFASRTVHPAKTKSVLPEYRRPGHGHGPRLCCCRTGRPALGFLHDSRRRGAWLRAPSWDGPRGNDANGELYVPSATSLPQWLPGKNSGGTKIRRHRVAADQWRDADVWLKLRSESVGRFAVDNEMRTWWQPAADDAHPVLTSQFPAPATIHAVRVIWRDVGLDSNRGVMPGPFRYRVELETAKDKWTTILDRSESTEDLLIDYRELC